MARMSDFAIRLGLILAALCLGGQAAHAQASPVPYWVPGWPFGFGNNLDAGPSADTYGNFPSFDGTDSRSGAFSYARYNFPNGFFVGSEHGAVSSFSQDVAFGNFGSLSADGVQFGYKFQNSPLNVYGGFDTLTYNSGIGPAFAPFAPASGTAGYSAHAGIEFKPASNLSLSLGASYTQTSGRIDSDSTLPSLSGASQFDLVGGRH